MALDIERAKRDGVMYCGNPSVVYKYRLGPNSRGQVCLEHPRGDYDIIHADHLSNLPDPIEQCREKGIVIAELWEDRWVPIRGGCLYAKANGWVPVFSLAASVGMRTPEAAARAVLEHESKR